MRWTQAARATKRAARGRRRRVVLTSRRRCQALRKLTLLRGDGDKKARSPGRARRKPLKPFAQGMPGRSGEPVVTMLVCFIYFAREATGALTHPAFPAPSVIEGISCNNPDVLRRGKAGACAMNVIASQRVARMRARWQAPRSNPESEKRPGSLRRSAPRDDEDTPFTGPARSPIIERTKEKT
jgi:hypothetical protein